MVNDSVRINIVQRAFLHLLSSILSTDLLKLDLDKDLSAVIITLCSCWRTSAVDEIFDGITYPGKPGRYSAGRTAFNSRNGETRCGRRQD